MTNTVNDQPLAVSPQLTDYLLAWQGAQSPSSRKMTLTQLNTFYLPKTGGTLTGALTISTGPLTISTGGVAVTAGGVTITAGGLTVTAGGYTVSGNSSVQGNISATGSITSTLGGLRANAGGLIAVGNSTITGSLTLISSGLIATTGAFSGAVSGTTGTFSGAISGTSGTYSAGLTATTGGFSGNVTVGGTLGITGALTGTSGVFSGLVTTGAGLSTTALTATTGTFSSTVSGTTANMSGAVNATVGGTIGGVLLTSNAVTAAVVTANGSSGSVAVSGFVYAPAGPSAFVGNTNYGVGATGSMYAANFYATSDVRLKSDIAPISAEAALHWLGTSEPVTFRKRLRYDSPESEALPDAGFLAQAQIRAGYGQYVGTVPAPGMPERLDADGFTSLPDLQLTLSPGYQVAYLAAALKAALARIEALEAARAWR